jgi:hypothetical protein
MFLAETTKTQKAHPELEGHETSCGDAVISGFCRTVYFRVFVE